MARYGQTYKDRAVARLLPPESASRGQIPLYPSSNNLLDSLDKSGISGKLTTLYGFPDQFPFAGWNRFFQELLVSAPSDCFLVAKRLIHRMLA